jgi:hypothetical protein
MAILGSLTDRTVFTQGGTVIGGALNLTFANSLPTIPNIGFVNPISIQPATASPAFGVQRGTGPTNSTLLAHIGSVAGASAPAFSVEIVLQCVWSGAL